MKINKTEFRNILKYALSLVIAGHLVSCQKPFSTRDISNSHNEETQGGSPEESPDGPIDPGPGPEEGLKNPFSPTSPFELSICSALSFSNLLWPPSLSDHQRNWFALALNISGSFEGHLAWSTISNNFDNMGLSLGLLQQNLGSGSLQPLLIDVRNAYPALFASSFSPSHLQSVNSMLLQWQSTVTLNNLDQVEALKEQYLFPPDEVSISDLDESFSNTMFSTKSISKNQQSINWATANLYKGSRFKEGWDREFMSLASTPIYRSLQLREAQKYHDRALKYFELFDFKQLRFYLLMYDFVVQNGGFKASHWEQYQTYRQQNPHSSEEERAFKLLAIRIESVRSQYKLDVKARKVTLIDGQGSVHGRSRVLPQEYCYSPISLVRLGDTVNP